MDVSTTIIGLLILALFIIPVLILSKSGKRKKNRFEKEFFSESSKNDLTITDKDFWNDRAIGIDPVKNRIIYLDWDNQERIDYIFDLNDIKSLVTEPGIEERKKKGYTYKKAERLTLRFCFKDSSRPDISVGFYTAGIGQQINEQAKLFEKWVKIASDKIYNRSAGYIKNSA